MDTLPNGTQANGDVPEQVAALDGNEGDAVMTNSPNDAQSDESKGDSATGDAVMENLPDDAQSNEAGENQQRQNSFPEITTQITAEDFRQIKSKSLSELKATIQADMEEIIYPFIEEKTTAFAKESVSAEIIAQVAEKREVKKLKRELSQLHEVATRHQGQIDAIFSLVGTRRMLAAAEGTMASSTEQ
jgi:hypothetical protein